ncbi:MAG: signal recognition particle-docking protein FtsY [Rhodospirillales bacterium]|nr:signal recognition particle-docking protein FtsY [Rhodospirillales bacterium]
MSAASGGWLGRLKAGLGRTSSRLADGLRDLVGRRGLDAQALADIEELLISADVGVPAAAKLAKGLRDRRLPSTASVEEVRTALAETIEAALASTAKPLAPLAAHRPHIILVCGVNGTGKTTTVAKLAHRFRKSGLSVMLAAADTFRAAAVDQLVVWAKRLDVPIVAKAPGADPAGVVFEAIETARASDSDVLLVDTAGRLHNKANLMAELEKIIRVIRKLDATAPHDCVLVLDGTTGQNTLRQVETFRDMVQITGLVVTKLDGSAKGGAVLALADTFGLPVHALGVGEGLDDLDAFTARDFARSLVGFQD